MAHSPQSPAVLERRQQALKQQIVAELDRYYQGSVVRATKRKPTRTGRGSPKPQPYAYVSRDTRRGVGHVYLPLALVDEVDRGVAQWKILKGLLRELADVNLQLLKARHQTDQRTDP